MKFSLIISMLILHVVLTGCASIIGGSGPQAIPVNTSPSEAKLEVTDLKTGTQVISASTPFTMMLNRSSGYFSKSNYKIKISKEGYIPQEHVLIPGLSGWYLGGNILFGGLIGWLVVDPATGAMYTFSEKNLSYSLYADNEIGRAAFKADQEKKNNELIAKNAVTAEEAKQSVQSYNPAFDSK